MAADAQTLRHHPNLGQQRIYWVYYRESADSPWMCYGGYYQASQAVQAVTSYRSSGYDAFYR